MIPIIAHRTCPLHTPENSLAGIRKAGELHADGVEVDVRRTLELVRERNLEPRVLMWSYREAAVRYFAEQAPEIESALLRDDVDPEGLRRFLEDATAFGARAISAHYAAITPQLVAEAHQRKLRVYSWIRDLETVEKKVSMGLDGIVTNEPAEVRAILSKESAVGTDL